MTSDLTDGERIVAFYEGRGEDDSGRTLGDILQLDFHGLEYTHDYIQWLFPTDARSRFQPEAPLVDATCRSRFQTDVRLRVSLERSLVRMLAFYGLELATDDHGSEITRAPTFAVRAQNWLTRGNHNFLRLTRILRSLDLLGRRDLALALESALEQIYSEFSDTIGSDTIRFWRSAVAP